MALASSEVIAAATTAIAVRPRAITSLLASP